MNKVAVLSAAPLIGLIAACGGSGSTTGGGSNGASTSSGAAAPASTSFSTGNTSLGTVLTTTSGMTLYYFTPEQGGTVACSGGCASTWPPLKANGTPSPPSGVTGTLGTVNLPDGSMEVTYNGWPLHTYSGDMAAGQTNGQGIGGKWFVATPSLSSSASGGGSTSTTAGGGY